jgi:hypothetical protein
MADSDVTAKTKKIETIVAYMLDEKYHWTAVDHPPLLGSEFPMFHAKLVAEFSGFNLAVRHKLKSLSDDDLGSFFDSRGIAKPQELKDWQGKIRAELSQKYSGMPSLFTAGLGKMGQMASIEYWSRMSFLTNDEVLWLSVGLEPSAFQKQLDGEPRNGFVEIPPIVFLRRRQEQVKRGLNPKGYGLNFEGPAIFEWVTRVGFEIHPRFREILRLMVAAIPATAEEPTHQSEVVSIAAVQEPDRRETKSLSTLILAMAIDHYGFDPDAGRSVVPKEIANLMASLGLDMTQETVLKYLRIGRHLLPKDWKPVP